MKLNPDHPYQPMIETPALLSQKIKLIKSCLKVEYEYTGEELARLKRELRDLYARRTELNKGNGFGN